MSSSLFRSICGVTLSLLLALTGQSIAAARGASAATGQMVICVGAQTMTVYVDADGQPTSTPHFCPDCTLTFGEPAVHYSAITGVRTGCLKHPSLSEPVLLCGGKSAFLSRGPPHLM